MRPEQKQTLGQFYSAATEQNAEKLRSLLTDDFTFDSTMMTFDNPDSYVEHLAGFCGSISQPRIIADGDKVVHLSILHANFPDGKKDIPLCDIFTFRDDKIAHQELFVDSKFFPSEA